MSAHFELWQRDDARRDRHLEVRTERRRSRAAAREAKGQKPHGTPRRRRATLEMVGLNAMLAELYPPAAFSTVSRRSSWTRRNFRGSRGRSTG